MGPIEFGHGLTDETSRLPTTGPVWGSLCHVDVFARSTCSASLIPTETSPPSNLQGFTLYHAYLVYDTSGRIHMASNPVPLKLVK